MDDAAESVRDFLTSERYRQGSRARHSDDLAFIANRLIDSMGLLRLAPRLQARFGLTIDDTEVVPTNFGTIGGVADLSRGERRPSGAVTTPVDASGCLSRAGSHPRGRGRQGLRRLPGGSPASTPRPFVVRPGVRCVAPSPE